MRASTAKQARSIALEHNEGSKKREEFRQLIVQSFNVWRKKQILVLPFIARISGKHLLTKTLNTELFETNEDINYCK